MATGCMLDKLSGQVVRHFTLAIFVLGLFSDAVLAQEIGLAGIMGSKALLMVNGGQPQAVSVGQTVDGVKLLSIQGEQALIEIGGKKRPLRVGQHAVGVSSAEGGGKVVLTANGQGHFFATGSVNGAAQRFIVDTGASMIALGASDARRLGLDFERGEKSLTQTANGQVVTSRLQLDTVRVGDITLHNVEAAILQTDMPVALLGMSFLNRMEMTRDGSTMILKKRF